MTDQFLLGSASYRSLCYELLAEVKKHVSKTHSLVIKAENVLKPPPNGRKFQRGENNFAAILTPELVRKMRKLREDGWSYRQLASEFDVDEKHAWRICNRNAWAWVE
jgi:hypothetical protein